VPFTYGIVTADGVLRAWQRACINKLDESGLSQLRCIIDAKTSPQERQQREAFDRFARGALSLAQEPLRDLIAEYPQAVSMEVSGLSFAAAQMHALQTSALDFVLCFGPRQLGLQISTTPKFGVWVFSHGDITKFESPLAGFWELYYDHDVTGAALLALTGADVMGVVLKAGYLRTVRTSFERNADFVLNELAMWPTHVCRDLSAGLASYSADKPQPKAPATFGFPTAAQCRSVRARARKNRAKQQFQQRFYLPDWTIGVLDASPADFVGTEAQAGVSEILPYERGRFVADPFVIHRAGKAFVFCELYLYKKNRGVIAVSEWEAPGVRRLTTVIEEPYHLSYPQVFEHDGSVYCLPESVDQKKVCLYKAIDFPYRWENVHTLLEDFAAVDSTLLQFQNRWWLFCTNLDEGYHSHLYIWSSDDLFGPWKPHPRNPVKIDVRSSGPAGPFFSNKGQLYRPAQDCARVYGGLVRINRVDVLSETDFKETVVGAIRPPRGRYDRGIHTVASSQGLCMVDVLRDVFEPRAIAGLFTGSVGAVARRAGVPATTIQAWKKRLGMS